MPFKLNISEKGKAYKLESGNSLFIGKKVGDTISGSEIDSKLEGFELKITGASSKEGFPLIQGVGGVGLKRVLLTKGKGMKQKKPNGLRLRKTVHANLIDEKTVQINLSVSKTGAKPLKEVFGTKEPEGKEMKKEKEMEEEKEETEEQEEEKAEEQPAEESEETEETAEESTEEAPAEEETEESEETAEETAEDSSEENSEESKEE